MAQGGPNDNHKELCTRTANRRGIEAQGWGTFKEMGPIREKNSRAGQKQAALFFPLVDTLASSLILVNHTLVVGDNLDAAILVDAHARVGGSEIDADHDTVVVLLLFLLLLLSRRQASQGKEPKHKCPPHCED